MSVHKSYLSKNNTIIYNSTTNTGLNPVTELFFGRADNVLSTPGYSRFIFDIDSNFCFDIIFKTIFGNF